MLKLTYTENSFKFEHLNETLEKWLKRRVILALRSANSFHIEPSTASFVISSDTPDIRQLEAEAKQGMLEICRCDAEMIEVILRGTWLTSDIDSDAGIFVTALSKSTEILLQELVNCDRSSVISYQ
jgi:hypothetical protein